MQLNQANCSSCQVISHCFQVCCIGIYLCRDCLLDQTILDEYYVCPMCNRQLAGAYPILLKMAAKNAQNYQPQSFFDQRNNNRMQTYQSTGASNYYDRNNFQNQRTQEEFHFVHNLSSENHQLNRTDSSNNFVSNNIFSGKIGQNPNINTQNQKFNQQFQTKNQQSSFYQQNQLRNSINYTTNMGYRQNGNYRINTMDQRGNKNNFDGQNFHNINNNFNQQKNNGISHNQQNNEGYFQNNCLHNNGSLYPNVQEKQHFSNTGFKTNIRQRNRNTQKEIDIYSNMKNQPNNFSKLNNFNQSNKINQFNHFNQKNEINPFAQPNQQQNTNNRSNNFTFQVNNENNQMNFSPHNNELHFQRNEFDGNQRAVKSAIKMQRVNTTSPMNGSRNNLKANDNQFKFRLNSLHPQKDLSEQKDLSPTFGFESNELTLNPIQDQKIESQNRGLSMIQRQQQTRQIIKMRRSNSEYTLGSRQ